MTMRVLIGAVSLSLCAGVQGAELANFVERPLVGTPRYVVDKDCTKNEDAKKHICRIVVNMSLDANGQCNFDLPDEVHTKMQHRVVEWTIKFPSNGTGFLDTTVDRFGFAKFKSLPAVAIYNDKDFVDWRYRSPLKFTWRIKDRSDPADMPRYFLLVRFLKKGDAETDIDKGALCAIKDPIITNDDSDYP